MKFIVFAIALTGCVHGKSSEVETRVLGLETRVSDLERSLETAKQGVSSHLCARNYYGCTQAFPDKEPECKKMALDCLSYFVPVGANK